MSKYARCWECMETVSLPPEQSSPPQKCPGCGASMHRHGPFVFFDEQVEKGVSEDEMRDNNDTDRTDPLQRIHDLEGGVMLLREAMAMLLDGIEKLEEKEALQHKTTLRMLDGIEKLEQRDRPCQ